MDIIIQSSFESRDLLTTTTNDLIQLMVTQSTGISQHTKQNTKCRKRMLQNWGKGEDRSWTRTSEWILVEISLKIKERDG